MSKYIGKRIIISILTVFVLATVTFFLVKILPGDPFLNDDVPEEIQQRQLEYYGLDRPVIEQYFRYMGNLLKDDLGTSLKYLGREVSAVIGECFPVSAKLGVTSVLFSYLVGLTFGILSAQFKNRWPDYVLMVVAIFGVAMPSMVIGPLMRYFFGVRLGLLPVSGWGTFKQTIMPAFVLLLSSIAGSTRSMRASMLGVTTQDYIKTAQSKGLSKVKIVLRHELKNSLIPTITGMGSAIAGIVMGSFVVEQIFVIPGLGVAPPTPAGASLSKRPARTSSCTRISLSSPAPASASRCCASISSATACATRLIRACALRREEYESRSIAVGPGSGRFVSHLRRRSAGGARRQLGFA